MLRWRYCSIVRLLDPNSSELYYGVPILFISCLEHGFVLRLALLFSSKKRSWVRHRAPQALSVSTTIVAAVTAWLVLTIRLTRTSVLIGPFTQQNVLETMHRKRASGEQLSGRHQAQSACINLPTMYRGQLQPGIPNPLGWVEFLCRM